MLSSLKNRLLLSLLKEDIDLVFQFNLVEYTYTGFSKEIYEVKISKLKATKNKIILSGANGERLYRK